MDHLPLVTFRPLTRDDLPRLATWLADPEVARWWGEEPGAVADRYGPAIDGHDPTQLFVVEVGGAPSGLVQAYRLADDPDWLGVLEGAYPDLDYRRLAGIDYLLGRPDVRRRGIGRRMIRAFSDRLLATPDLEGIVVDVQTANRPSWRALEHAGYHRLWSGQLASDDPSDAGPAYLYYRPVA